MGRGLPGGQFGGGGAAVGPPGRSQDAAHAEPCSLSPPGAESSLHSAGAVFGAEGPGFTSASRRPLWRCGSTVCDPRPREGLGVPKGFLPSSDFGAFFSGVARTALM